MPGKKKPPTRRGLSKGVTITPPPSADHLFQLVALAPETLEAWRQHLSEQKTNDDGSERRDALAQDRRALLEQRNKVPKAKRGDR